MNFAWELNVKVFRQVENRTTQTYESSDCESLSSLPDSEPTCLRISFDKDPIHSGVALFHVSRPGSGYVEHDV